MHRHDKLGLEITVLTTVSKTSVVGCDTELKNQRCRRTVDVVHDLGT